MHEFALGDSPAVVTAINRTGPAIVETGFKR
jgi:hypothetical protein